MRPMRLVAPTTRTVVSCAPGTVKSHMGPPRKRMAGSCSATAAEEALDIWPSRENLRHTSSNTCRDRRPSPTGFTITSSSATIPLPPRPPFGASVATPFLASVGSSGASSAVEPDLVAFLGRRDLRGFAAAVSLSSVADTVASLALAAKWHELP